MGTYAASVIEQVQLAYHAAPPAAYLLVAIGTTLFGNLVAIPAILLGFEGALGNNGFVIVPLVVLAGHLFGDLLWFSLGYGLADTRLGEWFRRQLPKHRRVEAFFESGSVYLLAFSKLLATPTVPILFLLGWYRTPPKRYVRLALISAGVWYVGILAFCLLVYSGLRIVF